MASSSDEIEPVLGGSIGVDRIDEDAERRLFDRWAVELRPDLFRYAFWLARDRALAEDIVQEALLRAWRAFGGLRDKQSVKQWLMTITRREYARTYQRKRLETTDLDALSAREEGLIAAHDDLDVREMRSAIFDLEAEYREPLVLQVLMGYKTEEIAGIMGISAGAVLTRLFRARRKLKSQLGWGVEE
ncbi:MAG: sigma-70 family RNA polymerase sigma factor [Gammaproteobacteria bacterium]|nr:sigma-70 family RNA polymerase sigma factor [Gammaproteobacteria bacterium]